MSSITPVRPLGSDGGSAIELSSPPTRVLIVDDHAMVRAGLRALLSAESDLLVVGETGDGAAAAPMVQSTGAKVVIMDLSMPGHGGLEALHEIRVVAPDTAILIFTGHPAEAYADIMLRHGVAGFLNKGCEPEAIALAIRTVRAGGRYFPPTGEFRPSSEKSNHLTLSPRQLQLLMRFARGTSVFDVSRSLGLSTKTVITHRGLLMKKLGLHTDAQLTRYAIRHQLLD